MPGAFQGLFSLKPSSGRISFKGAANTVDASVFICFSLSSSSPFFSLSSLG